MRALLVAVAVATSTQLGLGHSGGRAAIEQTWFCGTASMHGTPTNADYHLATSTVAELGQQCAFLTEVSTSQQLQSRQCPC